MDTIFGIMNVIGAMSTYCVGKHRYYFYACIRNEQVQNLHEGFVESIDQNTVAIKNAVQTLSFGHMQDGNIYDFLNLFEMWWRCDPTTSPPYDACNVSIPVSMAIKWTPSFDRKTAIDNGIESTLDAYLAGVPIEDILA